MFATNFTNPSSVTSAGVNFETPMQQDIRTTVPKQTFYLNSLPESGIYLF